MENRNELDLGLMTTEDMKSVEKVFEEQMIPKCVQHQQWQQELEERPEEPEGHREQRQPKHKNRKGRMMMENEGLITQEDIDMISKNSAAGDFEKKEEMKSLSGGVAAGGAAGAAGGGAAGAAAK